MNKPETRTELIDQHSLYKKIAYLLTQSRQTIACNINSTMVHTYFEIGRMIIEDEQKGKKRAKYGKELLKKLSCKLTKEFGKGFSIDNLENMRKVYLTYSTPQTLPTKSKSAKSETVSRISDYEPEFRLSWSHYLKLMRMNDVNERCFYEIEAFKNNWSLRELQRQFDSALYQRLALSRDKKAVKELAEKGQVINTPHDSLKDPYVLEFIGLPEKSIYSETKLEEKLIDKLEHFLLELGRGYTFVGRQKRLTFNDKHFRVDLVFYNRLLKCFVLIDLKIGEVKHQYLGQMQMYVNYYDRFVKLEEENKTMGIILCREKDDNLVEITLPKDNKQIFTSKYQTVLPNKEEFKKLLDEKD